MNKIFVDYGSTNVRAFLVSPEGFVLEEKEIPGEGALQAQDKRSNAEAFSDFISSKLKDWLNREKNIPIYMCGMVGSKQGWKETDYVDVPCGIEDFRGKLVPLNDEEKGEKLAGHPIFIVPGIKIEEEITVGEEQCAITDIIRAEETQIMGAVKKLKIIDDDVLSVGTHCKIARIEGGRIVHFETAPIGRSLQSAQEDPALRSFFNGVSEYDMEFFRKGLALAQSGRPLSSNLFQVRTRNVTGKTMQADSFASGACIGDGIKEVRRLRPEISEITLIVNPGKSDLYRYALSHFNIAVRREISDRDAVLAGLSLMANLESPQSGMN